MNHISALHLERLLSTYLVWKQKTKQKIEKEEEVQVLIFIFLFKFILKNESQQVSLSLSLSLVLFPQVKQVCLLCGQVGFEHLPACGRLLPRSFRSFAVTLVHNVGESECNCWHQPSFKAFFTTIFKKERCWAFLACLFGEDRVSERGREREKCEDGQAWVEVARRTQLL